MFIVFLFILEVGVHDLILDSTKKVHAASQTNFVIIITDDQRWDTLWAMPIVKEKLVNKGVTFTNAFATTPLCCPARASLLSGGYYPHHVGMLTNTLPNGGAEKSWYDTDTLGTTLQAEGYATGFIGKYLNKYQAVAPYIPPGWTRWVAHGNEPNWRDYNVVIGSSGTQPSQGVIRHRKQYITTFQRDEALAFLDNNSAQPFFLYFGTMAPHGPTEPLERDLDLFTDFTLEGRAYNEEDLSDKPFWVREAAAGAKDKEKLAQNQLRSLQAVDRAVGSIINKVEGLGKLDETVFIFTADHGLMWGEHGLQDKQKPYEESIRVPLVISMPGVEPRVDDRMIAYNLDVPATIYDILGLENKTDGSSLLPLLMNEHVSWRDHLWFQNYLGKGANPKWAGVRTADWKYIEFITGEKELYDLVNDPFELESQHGNSAMKERIAQMKNILDQNRGLDVTAESQSQPFVGQEFSFQLTAWGGSKPYRWSLEEGTLPDGLFLNSQNGTISGTPAREETQKVIFKVQDSSVAPHSLLPQSVLHTMIFAVKMPNIIFILTDDQDASTIEFMPSLNQLLIDEGTLFSNFIISNPLCCPSRATILRGQYAHNHKVYTNFERSGAFRKFHNLGREENTIATWLQNAGYKTALLGKYLNHYPDTDETHIPPGWDEWYAHISEGKSRYFNYALNENGTVVQYRDSPEEYETDVLAKKAEDIIRNSAANSEPFFIYLSTNSPHNAAIPAPRHEQLFVTESVPRPPSFNEEDVSDKPAHIRELRKLGPNVIENLDSAYRNRLRALQSIDEMIAGLVETLDEVGELDNTYIFYTIDNGIHTGQHRRRGKGSPYEEDINMPLIVRGPGVPKGKIQDLLAVNTDLAPTFVEIAGGSIPSLVDGRSLVPLLKGDTPDQWRSSILIEHWIDEGELVAAFRGLRTKDITYVEWYTGETELYDLQADPYQLVSVHDQVAPSFLTELSARLDELSTCAKQRCRDFEDELIAPLTVDLGAESPCGDLGDIDADGFLTQNDVNLMFDYIVQITKFTDGEFGRADVTGDGVVSVLDSVELLQYVNEQISMFRGCEGLKGPFPI